MTKSDMVLKMISENKDYTIKDFLLRWDRLLRLRNPKTSTYNPITPIPDLQ